MKKILSYILVLMLSISVLSTLVACDKPQDPEEPEGPIFSEEYVWDDEYHWRPQLNGSEVQDYAKHYNPGGQNTGRCKCGYYFPCINLVYKKITLDGIEGYELVDYDEYMSPNFYHVEVPTHYQGEEDEEPLPVLSIGRYALSNRASTATATYGRCDIKLKSVKLNEGLLRVGDGAFCHSNIDEIVIPNSVKGSLTYTFMQCSQLERIVIGNGISKINGYVFYGLPKCREVIIGNSVTEIRTRTFIDCPSLTTVVLPASLVSMPESSHIGNAEGCEPQYVILGGKNIKIFFNITREQLEELTIPLFPRDANGNLLNEDGTIAHEVVFTGSNYEQQSFTTRGFAAGWNGTNTIYCLGEWHYDESGKAVPNN